MNRQEANRIILKQISNMVESCPDLRFQQILHVMNISRTKFVEDLRPDDLVGVDLFNEESAKTLEMINFKQDA